MELGRKMTALGSIFRMSPVRACFIPPVFAQLCPA